MPENVNTLFRLHRIFEKAYNTNSSQHSIVVWGDIFGIPPGENRDRRFVIIPFLNKLHGEIQLAQRTMESTSFSKSLYQTALAQIDSILGVEGLMNNWATFRHQVNTETLLALKWCAESLPSEEKLIDESELAELKKELLEFKEGILKTTKSPELQQFLLNQISIIEQAILEYQIIGMKAFDLAQTKAFTDFVQSGSVVKRNEGRDEINKLAEFWMRIRKYVDGFSKIVHLLKDAKDLIDMGSGFLS